VTRKILIDRAGALVVGEDRESGTARVHPAFAAFCKDWGVDVAACRPYRARTKARPSRESGVGYVKKNAIAGISFTSFAALEAHLSRWMVEADERVHGTTHERPDVRFERDERTKLLPLPSTSMPVRERRVVRTVANDCFVDIDTIRYSVPRRFVKRRMDVLVGDTDVVIFDGGTEVARHRRHDEPHQRIANPAHFEGIFRSRTSIFAGRRRRSAWRG
jgi:hypothetical protein